MRVYRVAVVASMLVLAGGGTAFAHKDHQKQQAPAAASGRRAGMDHGAMTSREHDPSGAASNGTVEVADHGERRERAKGKPFGVRLLDRLGRWHTAVVHFPMGLILAAVIAEIIGWRRQVPDWNQAARIMLGIGAVGAVAAAILGWINAGFAMTDTDGVLTAHRWLGTTLAALAVVLAYVAWRSTPASGQPRVGYRLLLALVAAGIAVQGYLGGSLVHGGLDHLAF